VLAHWHDGCVSAESDRHSGGGKPLRGEGDWSKDENAKARIFGPVDEHVKGPERPYSGHSEGERGREETSNKDVTCSTSDGRRKLKQK